MDGDAPVPAKALGEALTAIARDYQESTGRELALAGIDKGSLVVVLGDAASALKDGAEYAKAVGSIAEFSKAVFRAYDRRREGRRKKGGSREPGDRTVDGLIKLAKTTKRDIRYRRESPDGERVELDITEPVLAQIHAAEAIEDQRARPVPLALEDQSSVNMDALALTLESAATPEVNAIVLALVTAMRDTDGGASLLALADALQRRGNGKLAAEVRRAMDAGTM